MTECRELETLLDARPDLMATLDHLLDVDAEQETWDPAAVDIEPDTITTLVAGGYVEATADGYRVSDRSALRTAVNRHRRTRTTPTGTASALSRHSGWR